MAEYIVIVHAQKSAIAALLSIHVPSFKQVSFQICLIL